MDDLIRCSVCEGLFDSDDIQGDLDYYCPSCWIAHLDEPFDFIEVLKCI